MENEKELILKAVESFQGRFIIISPEFKILFCAAMEEGIAKESIVGRHCYEALYKRGNPCDNCAAADTIKKKDSAFVSILNDFLNEDKIHCRYSYPISSDDGIEAFVSMDFDLPIYSDLEEKAKYSSSLLRNLIHNAVDGVIAADKKGNIVIFNEAAEKISGYSAREAMSILNIRDIYPDKVAREIMEKLRSEKFGGKGKLKQYHISCIGKNNEMVPISLNASIIYKDGKETATIGFFHDRREELKIKKKLEKTRIQLLQAEKMSSLGKLSAGVAHQLNNPLGSITLFIKLIMEDYELEEPLQKDMERVLEDAKRCKKIVKELLEFTRQTNYIMRSCDINKALRRTLFLLENQAIFQNIKIEKKIFQKLPMISANEQQLNHVFMNIILNAAQAMEGKGKLEVSTDFADGEKFLEVRISDSGPGIPNEILSNIFDPFFTTKEEGKGTGLGLSLVYGIVKKHGGVVAAESRPGRTTFIIKFPIQTEQEKKDEG